MLSYLNKDYVPMEERKLTKANYAIKHRRKGANGAWV
jgi:hypothetical protein